MAGIENDLNQIRQALYGREVREALAHGLQQCYSDVQSGKTLAENAARQASKAAEQAMEVAGGFEVADDNEVKQELGIA